MNFIRDMIVSHPQKTHEPQLDSLVNVIRACFNAGQACVTCADACIGGQDTVELLQVIRLNNDCSDICIATGKSLSRLYSPDWNTLRAQMRSCLQIVQDTSALCQQHARMHEHCRICADSCRACETSLKDYYKLVEHF
jgi:hypothetical protein